MINAALNDGAIKGNPLKGYKSPAYVDPVRDYLTDEELNKIENFAEKSKSEKLVKVANWFLFSCYSGLRYEDVRTFNKKSIINDRIILRTEKSKTDVSIKIHPKLKNVLENISSEVISNQKMNDFLKVIAETCQIQKNLTFHLARHTFAVYFLNHGGSMETLSKLLGHSSLRTTSIYGKITDIRIDSEMDKVWG
jgi:integrase